MELTYLLVHLLAALSVSTSTSSSSSSSSSSVHGEAIGVTETINEEQLKVHEECRNPDYKRYVKCLMRPKRHHHNHGDGSPDTDPVHCLESCLKKCGLEHDCDKKCSHCTKRYKHKHQIVTEYETSCESGVCDGGGDALRTTNITTNIGINNIINGVLQPGSSTTPKIPPVSPVSPLPPYLPPYPPIPGNGDNGNRTHGVYVPSIPLVPQISMVPQITYALGGGCFYSQWLCVQQPPSQPDCSVCGNPLLQHRCNVTFCYSAQFTATGVGTPCKSPACVGAGVTSREYDGPPMDVSGQTRWNH